jgi:hypothetical protein
MQDPDEFPAGLVVALREVNFDERYYGFYEQIRNRTTPSGLSKRDWDKALAETGLTFRYDAKERFYSTEKQFGNCIIKLIVAFRHDRVELILDVKTPNGRNGGPFAALANSVGLSRNPSFSPTPPFPALPFSNIEGLREIIGFAMTLYGDAERAVVSSKLCEQQK